MHAVLQSPDSQTSRQSIVLFVPMSVATATPGHDVNVTLEDQQKINRFARLNARLDEIREELKHKKLEMQNMDDALNEIQVAELEGEDERVRINEGEVFVQFGLSEASTWIEDKKNRVQQDVDSLSQNIETIKEEMNQLKTILYAKFGRENINLEADE